VSAAKPGQVSDRDLVAAIAGGKVEALRELNSRYGRMLTALAMRFLGNESDAEEVASDSSGKSGAKPDFLIQISVPLLLG